MKRSTIAFLVAVHFLCGLHTAFSKTITHDEPWRLPAGILHWRTGRFDQEILSPPLTRLWAGIPGAIAGVNPVPEGKPPYDVRQFVFGVPDYRTWYLWGRAFNLAFSVGTLLIVIRWAEEWFGPWGARIAGLLCATCPNILAHASLVTTDAGLMFAFTAVLYALVRWLDRRSWGGAVTVGLLLGLAQTTKFSAVLLYPMVLPIWVVWRRSPQFASAALPRGVRWQMPVVLLLSLVGWNAGYLFQGFGQPLKDYAFMSQSLRSLQSLMQPVDSLPVPLPHDYLIGFDAQRAVMEQQHPVYLDGRWTLTGFRSYYLRTMQYKLPHVAQVLIVAGLLLLLFRRDPEGRRGLRLLTLWLPVVVLLGIASASAMQLGVRYVLPVLPLMFVTAAAAGRGLERWNPRVQQIAFAAAIVACGFSLRHHPHHLAYFNELTGGPVEGRYHLVDSNLDWGQDLHLVKQFMDREGIGKIGLVYFGTMPPDALGIDYEISPGWRPKPGWHAVSVNYVMGRPHLLAEPDGTSRAADLNEFAYFQQFKPVARLGYSIDVYRIGGEREEPETADVVNP